jgi:alginate O-acetyltransferase complex protein AlgI
MVFNSVGFALFLAAVLLLDRLPFQWRARKINLLAASLVFYSAWYPPALLLLLATLSLDFAVARLIGPERAHPRRRLLLVLSLLANFGSLAFFKYAGFFWDGFSQLAQALNLDMSAWQPSWFLPLGISFYTFQSVSYVLDVYRGHVAPTRSWLDFALFVSFFPHLVAGPIVRYGDFGAQLVMPRRADAEQFSRGLTLLILGLFLKVTLGDAVFAPLAEAVYGAAQAQPAALGTAMAWAGILGFSGQLYCDFAGYSMCAVGLALCFGFRFPWNFHLPYGSTSFSEFWTRWHISLSTWIRDYIYLPLGGNRHGRVRTAVNLMLAFVFSGFWHGASWTFGIWGAIHGVLVVLEKALGQRAPGRAIRRVPAIVRAAGVTVIYALTLVFFRSPDLDTAGNLLAHAFAGGADQTGALFDWQIQLCFLAMAGLFAFHFAFRARGPIAFMDSLAPPARSCLLAALMVITLTTLPATSTVFLYFQF